MALTDTAIRKAKPATKEWKLADERGLYLLVTPNGSKLWRLKYRYHGQEKKLALGNYPDMGLKDARAKRDEVRRMLADDVDPGRAKKDARIAQRISAANTFAAIAAEYLDKMEQEGKAPATLAKVRWLLTLLTPAIGSRPIAEISAHELLEILRKIERAGKREPANRMRSFASRVLVRKYKVLIQAFGGDAQKIGKNEGSYTLAFDAFETELLKLRQAACLIEFNREKVRELGGCDGGNFKHANSAGSLAQWRGRCPRSVDPAAIPRIARHRGSPIARRMEQLAVDGRSDQ